MNGVAAEPFTMVLVEDDEGHARLLRKDLQRAGVMNPVTHVTTGEAALDLLRRIGSIGGHAPVVVLLDLNLPDIDGFEILRRLKNDPATRDMPVIVLTTTDRPGDVDRCYALGCGVFITKPVGYDVFSESIGKLGLALTVVRVPHMKP